jgi:glucokinase
VTDALYGAIDLGGTNVRSIVASLDANIRGDDKRPSNAEDGLEACLNTIDVSLRQACSQAGIEPGELKAIGLASPGWVDVERGVVPAAPQLPGWRDVPIVRILSDRFGPPVILENDANAGALGENVFGAGRGARHMVYITVSTGVGGGIIADGKLYGGARGSAGEIGHTVVDTAGPLCGCGNYGCLEAVSSGTAIARRAVEAVERGESTSLALVRARGEEITADVVAEAAEKGDAVSREIYAEAGRLLGVAMANLVNLLSPEKILIGGGVTQAAHLFMPQAENTMRTLALSEPLKHVELGLAELGDSVGVLGMIARLREEYGESV